MIKCQCGQEWPCPHEPATWHNLAGVHVEDDDVTFYPEEYTE